MFKLIKRFQEAITKPDKALFPIIAAVHGPVIGLGVDIVSSCDIRYAAENSVFAIKVCSSTRLSLCFSNVRLDILGS